MADIQIKKFAGIQYLGIGGVSHLCRAAIAKLIHFGDVINEAKLLTCSNRHFTRHCFLLTINFDDLVAIKSGFSSGYRGGGPRALSIALQLLERHGAKILEYEVSQEIIDRIDYSCLTNEDIDSIEKSTPLPAHRIYDDYILPEMNNLDEKMARVFPKAIPFAIIDSRLIDLALKFREQPDNAILTGYRRLEDIVRKRTGLQDVPGNKLFSKAFSGESSILVWKGINSGEQTGRAQLFTGTYMAYRNPRAHRELSINKDKLLEEFLLLNHLYSLERESVVRDDNT